MDTPNIRCTVVEVECDHSINDHLQPAKVRELLPWADPFIAELVGRYRLKAALDDSLSFLAHEAAHPASRLEAPLASPLPRASRFSVPTDEGPATGSSNWPW